MSGIDPRIEEVVLAWRHTQKDHRENHVEPLRVAAEAAAQWAK